GRERIRQRRRVLSRFVLEIGTAKRSAHPRVQVQSAGGRGEAVRQRPAVGEAGVLERLGIASAEIGEERRVAQADSRRRMLMLREKVRRTRRKPAVVEKAQQCAVDQKTAAVAGQKAMG